MDKNLTFSGHKSDFLDKNLTFWDINLTFSGQKTDRKAENWKIRALGNVKKQKIGFLEVGKLEFQGKKV